MQTEIQKAEAARFWGELEAKLERELETWRKGLPRCAVLLRFGWAVVSEPDRALALGRKEGRYVFVGIEPGQGSARFEKRDADRLVRDLAAIGIKAIAVHDRDLPEMRIAALEELLSFIRSRQ